MLFNNNVDDSYNLENLIFVSKSVFESWIINSVIILQIYSVEFLLYVAANCAFKVYLRKKMIQFDKIIWKISNKVNV